jgi:putative FmdB family regulatory protein
MPMYEYKCQQCGTVFEVLQKFSDKPLKIHQECGGPVERLLSTPAFQFKGSGFYITDYGHKHSSGANGHAKNSESGSNGAPTPAAGTKSESKPAASSDARK